MLKYLSFISALFLFVGCGGSDENTQSLNKILSSNLYKETKVLSKHNVPNDPLYKDQWYLNGKFGINIDNLWDSYLGDGVSVSILDSGIEAEHEDLKQSIDFSRSYRYSDNRYDPSYIPTQKDSKNFDLGHGTAVAGIISSAHNGIGIMGIAPNVDLVSLNVFSDSSDDAFRDAISRDGIDISSNSWGKNIADKLEDDRVVLDAIKEKMKRDPIIYIFSSGNEYSNVNYSSVLSSRYTLVVGASTKSGYVAPYSNYGSSLLCVAPGGDRSGIVTTDLNGDKLGYDTKLHHYQDIDNQNYNYTDNFKGTSASAAMLSGVVALMLEANPNLSYRDVRYIIAHTSFRLDRSNPSWQRNNSGVWFSNDYGFGLVDAKKAVEFGKEFESLGSEVSITKEIKNSTDILDSDLSGIYVEFDVDDDFVVEYAMVTLDLEGENSSDLDIELISKSGTRSNLATANSRLKDSYHNWSFGSLAFMDERSDGVWKLHIADARLSNKRKLNSAKLTLYGHYN